MRSRRSTFGIRIVQYRLQEIYQLVDRGQASCDNSLICRGFLLFAKRVINFEIPVDLE